MSAVDDPTDTSTSELRFRLRGGLYEPGEPEYADACTLFNSMIVRRPRLVARCAAPDDVIASLAFAREHELELAVRAGGHSVTGRSLCDDGLVLDLRAMCDVDVDAERRIARVGGGATWADVDRDHAGPRARHHRRACVHDRGRRAHPGRRLRLARAQARPRLRQPRGGRARDRRGRAGPRLRGREPGAALGAARRRRRASAWSPRSSSGFTPSGPT